MRHWLRVIRWSLATVTAGLFVLLCAPAANAVNPATMSFQGKVVNANGTNVTDGTYGFVFKLYTVSSGGSAIWTETDSSVGVTAGVFQVNLGANCPFFTANACNGNTPVDFNANPNLFLGITFNADPAGEMSPRVQLQSVPFAFNADRVGGLSVSQLVQLSPAVQQTGFINVDGNISSGATIQGSTVNAATGISTAGTQRIDNSGNLLNIGNLSGSSALAVAAGGTAQNLTLDASTSGKVQIGATSTGDIELGGGLSSSGCTLTNSNGNFACSGSLTAVSGLAVGSNTTAGTAAFSDGSGGTVTISTPTLAGSYGLSLPTSGPAVSQCLKTDTVTASQLVFGDCANMGQKIMQTFSAYGVNQAANATTTLNYLLPTSNTAVSFALAGTAEFKAAAAGSFRACSDFGSANVTGGSVSVRFRKNGADIDTNNYCTLDTTNPRSNSQQIDSGVETFAAGDTIGVALVSTGLAPTTSEHWVSFTIEYGAGGVGPTTLNDAYTNGNTINTTDASDISFNLNNTTTDPNFLVNIATGSTGRFAVQNNGSDVFAANATGTTTTGNATFSQAAANTLSVVATAAPTTDMLSISNAGQPITTAGINAQQIDYYANLGVAGNVASALRVNITNTSATAGTTTNALRVVTTTAAAAGDTNGIAVDGITAGSGTDSAINIGTGWSGGLLRYNGSAIISGIGILQSVALSGSYANAVTFTNAANAFSGSGAGLTGLNASSLAAGTIPSSVFSGSYGSTLTFSNAANSFSGIGSNLTALNAANLTMGTVASAQISGSYGGITGLGTLIAGTWNATAIGAQYGGTGLNGATAANGSLLIGNGSGYSLATLTAGSNLGIANAAGSITLGVANSPTFSGMVTANAGEAITGSVTVNQAAADNFKIQATAAPASDMVSITNSGFPNTTAGVNAEQIDYYSALTTAASEAASVRLNITNTSTVATTTTDGLRLVVTSSAATGTTNGLKIDGITGGSGTENAINIGAGWNTLISSPSFSVAGNGSIYGNGFNYFDPSSLTQATGATGLNSGGSTGGNFGGTFDSGAFIGNTDAYSQEFVGSKAVSTANNQTYGDDGKWYFNNNAQANVSAQDISATGGYVRLTSGTTTGRGGLITEGATAGTMDGPLAAANLPIVQMKVRISTASAADDLVFGMMNTATALTTNDPLPTNGIVFFTNNAASSGTTGWQGIIRSGGVTRAAVTCPSPAFVTTGQFATGRIVVINATQVRFFLDPDASNGIDFIDCGVATVTAANMPAVAMAMAMQFTQTNTTGGVTADLGYARYWQDDAAVASASAAATVSGEQTLADISTGSDQAATSDPVVSAPPSGSTPEITAADTGSLPAAGPSLTAVPGSDGSTQLMDSSGQPKLTFDSLGNASLPGSLSLTSASLSGSLTVDGDATFAGLSVFQKLATYLAKVVFRQDVEIDGHLTVGADTAGYAKLRSGENSVHVSFAKPYDTTPIVSVAPTGGQFVSATVTNITSQGFDVQLQAPAVADTTLSWTAVGVINPQTSSNPPPGATLNPN